MITVSVLLEEGIGGKLAGLAAGGAKEIAVDVRKIFFGLQIHDRADPAAVVGKRGK
jgi:hypothetical protein